MEIRVLKYFLTVAREGGINKASEVLHITQPTLSRQLLALEEEVGVKLFDKSGRKLKLTNEGMLLRRRAEEILSLVDRTERELLEQEEEIEGTIVLGCGEFSAMEIVADLIAGFREKYPKVTFDILTATADVVKDQMEHGLVDIGILLKPIDLEKFDFMYLECEERIVVMMRPDDPLAQKSVITPEDLQDKPIILPKRANVQNNIRNWFGGTLKEEQVIATGNLATNCALLVRRGLGYMLLVEGALTFWDESKITYRPLSPEITTGSLFAWKRNQPLPPAVSRFIAEMKVYLESKQGYAFKA